PGPRPHQTCQAGTRPEALAPCVPLACTQMRRTQILKVLSVVTFYSKYTRSLSFQNFCTEALFDVLRVYDGPDTNSTLIGTFSGNVTPPVLRAFSGAMTLHFRTDLSVVCTGWNASWYTIVPPPVPPVISQVSAQCLSSNIDLTLNGRVHCDSVYPGAFVLSGAPARTVVAAQALNCVGDSTSQLRLTLNSPFSDCAAYGLQWTLNMLDFCDSLYVFILNSSFVINDCPLAATLIASNDSICIGGCITLTAQPSGGTAPVN
ncbi:MAG: CUB domain-containing protein, partial [Bacteroidota bacterium]